MSDTQDSEELEAGIDRIATDGGVSVQKRAEALRLTHTEELEAEKQCQTWFGESKEEAHQCEADASHQVELENEYGDEISMAVCPACKAAYESRGESNV